MLIALGVWPETGRQEVLAWQLTEGEGCAAWLQFLSALEAQGLLGDALNLIIHDDGSGLCAALRFLELGVAEQRCLFHKLKNIAKAIELAEELLSHERWRKRKAILRDFQAIWQAKTCQTVLRRYLQVYHQYRQYRETQPKAVATLRRDFRATTLTYYQVQQVYPNWQRRFLRTTSRLERFNRSLRGAFVPPALTIPMTGCWPPLLKLLTKPSRRASGQQVPSVTQFPPNEIHYHGYRSVDTGWIAPNPQVPRRACRNGRVPRGDRPRRPGAD